MSDQRERLQQVLAGRYDVARALGSGGMATVYLAEDRKHHRQVAIKLLHEELAHSIGVQRFLREIDLVARLQHPHLLTLIDSGEVDGIPYYVMPFVEGQSLASLLEAEGPLPAERAVAIAREVADGLQYAHEHGVVHRDIKPANILMSGGHAVVSDFGIATALDHATQGRMTATGVSLGSPTYMSPEQAAGERDLDARTDIYSLGCVLYEMLTGVPPVDDPSIQTMVTKKMLGQFPTVRARCPDVPPGVDAAVTRAVATNPGDRFSDARTFSQALADGLPARPSRRARGPLVLAAVAVVALVVVSGWFATSRVRADRRAWAVQQLAEIERLAINAQFADAFVLAARLDSVLPGDTVLARLRPQFTDFMPVRTTPPGARVYGQWYEMPADEWQLLGTTPIDSLPLPKWGSERAMRLRIEADGYGPIELLPHAIADWGGIQPVDTLTLYRVEDIPDGMIPIPGFWITDPLHPNGDSIRFKPYFIGRFEVTNGEYKGFVDAGGYRDASYWTGPCVRDGQPIPWEEAVAAFKDRTGRPGPSTWEFGTYPEGQEDYPVAGVSYCEAAAYARFAGASLPSSTHWDRAVRSFRRETSWIFVPRSNLGGPGPRVVGADRSMSGFGVYDAYGNVREWMVNPMEGGRVTRGGAWSDPAFQTGWFVPRSEFDRDPTNGIRLMWHTEDDTTYAHVTNPRRRNEGRDFREAVPVPDAEYAIYRRLYAYDSTPLHARVETEGATEHWEWQKVTFDAAYGGERAGAYLFFPLERSGRLQPIIYWPGSGAMTSRVVDWTFIEQWTGWVMRSGRVLVLPLFKGSYERDDADFSIRQSVPSGTTYYRDLAIQWIKDLGRTIDYLETRDDIDAGKIGFYGHSWGGQIAPIALTAESRIGTAVLDVGGLWTGTAPLPEVEPVNYLPHVQTPVLMLNGRYDVVFPLETSQLPFFRLLGTPPAHKQHYVYPLGHLVPRGQVVEKSLDWFDRYLGPP